MCLNIIISNSSDIPIFKQIKNAIKEDICNDKLLEGEAPLIALST